MLFARWRRTERWRRNFLTSAAQGRICDGHLANGRLNVHLHSMSQKFYNNNLTKVILFIFFYLCVEAINNILRGRHVRIFGSSFFERR